MKRLIFIGGPMGVGKTSVSKLLQTKLKNTVYLDGDWCWFTNPWILTDETRKMVIDNIVYLLNNFIKNQSYENIIFSWILYSDEIIGEITSRLNMNCVSFYNFSLIASEREIVKRLNKDLEEGIRSEHVVIERSLARLKQFKDINTIKIDTSSLKIKEVVIKILNEVGEIND